MQIRDYDKTTCVRFEYLLQPATRRQTRHLGMVKMTAKALTDIKGETPEAEHDRLAHHHAAC